MTDVTGAAYERHVRRHEARWRTGQHFVTGAAIFLVGKLLQWLGVEEHTSTVMYLGWLVAALGLVFVAVAVISWGVRLGIESADRD